MHKFLAMVLILIGALLMFVQWGGDERSFKTAQLLIDLVAAHGPALGKSFGRAYILTPPLSIMMGLIMMVSEMAIPKINLPRRH